MKYRRIGLFFGLIVFSIPILILATFVGQKNTFFDVAKDKDIEIVDAVDVSSKEAEEIIMALDSNDLLSFNGSPIPIKKIKDALKFEHMTYSDKVDSFKVKTVTIEENYYAPGSGKHVSLCERNIGRSHEVDTEQIDFGLLEYPYRVPWQVMVTSDFLTGDESIGFTTNALQSIFKYAYSGNNTSYFKKGVETTAYEYLEVDNHTLVEVPLVYITYDNNFYMTDGGSNYTTYYKEDKEVTTTRYYSYDDGYELEGKDRSVNRTVTTKETVPLLRQISTPYKTIDYNYSKNEVKDELVDVWRSVKVHRNEDGEKTGKTVKTVERFLTISEVVESSVTESVSDERFKTYLEDVGLSNSREELLQFASLNIGGIEAVSEMLSVSNTSLMFISDIYYDGFQYMNIELTPEELAAPIPRFAQNDARWSKLPYGNSTIGRGGCGPTSMAMIATGLTRNIVSPVEMAYLSANNGYKVSAGTRWDFFSFAASRYGLNVRQATPASYGEMLDALKEGNPVIASVGPGHFTSNGHFIVLVAIDKDGIIVNDPYDPYNKKNKSWDPRIIINEASQYFIFEKEVLS